MLLSEKLVLDKTLQVVVVVLVVVELTGVSRLADLLAILSTRQFLYCLFLCEISFRLSILNLTDCIKLTLQS